jgi:2-amino-4-hydroxy-6-hydroxymethyldihydropteridine diphosphokinase
VYEPFQNTEGARELVAEATSPLSVLHRYNDINRALAPAASPSYRFAMRTSAPVTAYLGLGSNVGDRELALGGALARLAQTPDIELVRFSKFVENPAVGGPQNAPPFLNAAAEIRTTLGSHALLQELLEIERSLGRLRREKWAPRTIDLDILLFGDHIISSDDLIVPHPLMHERRFVLQPLAEIAPDVVHPTLMMTIAGLLEPLAI